MPTSARNNGLLTTAALAAAMWMAMTLPGLAQSPKYKPITVKTPDGLTISAQEWGNPNGPEILFIHGYSQSYLSWSRQTDSDLVRDSTS
jgi:non-heme chloroperoxidase